MRSGSGTSDSTARMLTTPTATATPALSNARSSDSISTSRAIRPRLAPIARRTAMSRVRCWPRTSSRFAALIQAIASTITGTSSVPAMSSAAPERRLAPYWVTTSLVCVVPSARPAATRAAATGACACNSSSDADPSIRPIASMSKTRPARRPVDGRSAPMVGAKPHGSHTSVGCIPHRDCTPKVDDATPTILTACPPTVMKSPSAEGSPANMRCHMA